MAIENRLTPREEEIASFVVAGLSNKQTREKASISEGTVKIHLHRAYTKLGIVQGAEPLVITRTVSEGSPHAR